jgi:hypothetical protein
MQNRKFNAKLSYAKQSDIDTTPPYSLKQIVRVVSGKEHYSTWTLRMGYFRYGEQVRGEFCKNDLKPSIHITWSTAINRMAGKDNSSEIIYNKEEFEDQITFFGGEATPLGKHFRKFANLYYEEWDNQLVKWCRWHILRYGVPHRNAEQIHIDAAEDSLKHLPDEKDF